MSVTRLSLLTTVSNNPPVCLRLWAGFLFLLPCLLPCLQRFCSPSKRPPALSSLEFPGSHCPLYLPLATLGHVFSFSAPLSFIFFIPSLSDFMDSPHYHLNRKQGSLSSSSSFLLHFPDPAHPGAPCSPSKHPCLLSVPTTSGFCCH